MPNQLRILIAGASARAAAFSALRSGFDAQTVDLFADLDLRRRCPAARVLDYPEGLERELQKRSHEPDFTNGPTSRPTMWMFTGALENYPDLVDRVAKYFPFLGTSGSALRVVRDPMVLAQAVRAAGFPFPETLKEDSPSAALCSSAKDSWLWKPYSSSGGQQIREVLDSARCEPVATRSASSGLASGYYQEKITGPSVAAIFVAAGGESSQSEARLLGMTQQLVGPDWSAPHPFSYAGSVGPLALSPQQTDDLTRLGQTLCQRFDLRGLFGVDMISQGGTFWPVEVNPRYTASVEVLERALDLRAIKLHADACRGRELNDPPTPQAVQPENEHATTCGKAILFASRDLVVPAEFEDHAINRLDAEWPEIADVPAAGTQIETGQPITTLFATGSNLVSVQDTLRKKMNDLEQRFFV